MKGHLIYKSWVVLKELTFIKLGCLSPSHLPDLGSVNMSIYQSWYGPLSRRRWQKRMSGKRHWRVEKVQALVKSAFDDVTPDLTRNCLRHVMELMQRDLDAELKFDQEEPFCDNMEVHRSGHSCYLQFGFLWTVWLYRQVICTVQIFYTYRPHSFLIKTLGLDLRPLQCEEYQYILAVSESKWEDPAILQDFKDPMLNNPANICK